MDYQVTFNHVLNFIRNQGGPSMRNGSCAYRGDLGTKCAVGCLIRDEDYNPFFENLTPTNAFVMRDTEAKEHLARALTNAGFTNEDASFLSDLQSAHDSALPVFNEDPPWMEKYEMFMRALAVKRGLVYTPPKEQ